MILSNNNSQFLFTILLVSLFINVSCKKNGFIKAFNNKINQSQEYFIENNTLKDEFIKKEFQRLRKIFLDKIPIEFLDKDSKYILFESFDYQTAIYTYNIYSNDFSYKFQFNTNTDSNIFNNDKPIYSQYLLSNILEENFELIEEQQNNEGIVNDGNRIYTYLVKLSDNSLKILPFVFDEFPSALVEPQ